MVNAGRKEIGIEAITSPRGLLELEEWKREVAFLDESNELALGSGEKGAVTEKEIIELFSPWFVKATPFTFYGWELIGIPFSYIFGEKNPKRIGLERAERYIDALYESFFGKEEKHLGAYKAKLLQFEGEIRKIREKKEKERKEEESAIPLRDYLAIIRELGIDPFEDVEIKGDKVKIGGINRERLEEGLRNLREREEEEGIRREAQRTRYEGATGTFPYESRVKGTDFREYFERIYQLAQENPEAAEMAYKITEMLVYAGIVEGVYQGFGVLENISKKGEQK